VKIRQQSDAAQLACDRSSLVAVAATAARKVVGASVDTGKIECLADPEVT
jgi:hypothetical protein